MDARREQSRLAPERDALSLSRARAGSWGRIVKARLRAVLRHAGPRVLDVGCSGGAYVQALRAKGFEACGCDLLDDPAWRPFAESHCLVADLRALPFPDGAFDTCSAFEVLEHVADVGRALGELRRVCTTNIIVSVPNCAEEAVFEEAGLAYHHWTDRTHVQQFDAESLRRTLTDNGFTVQLLQGINPIMPEILALAAWRMPLPLARIAGQLCRRLPLRRRYCMTLLAVAARS